MAKVFAFLRPSLVVLAVFGALAWLSGGRPVLDWPGVGPAAAEFFLGSPLDRVAAEPVVLPHPQLGPREVVELQLAGLSDPRPDGVGILQCYCLASPGNRLITGPLDRFGAMVRSGPYACLARPRRLLIGRPLVSDGKARVLVTVLDEHMAPRSFRFLLSKQPDPPFSECWMTEGVQLVNPPDPPARSPAADPPLT